MLQLMISQCEKTQMSKRKYGMKYHLQQQSYSKYQSPQLVIDEMRQNVVECCLWAQDSSVKTISQAL